MRLKALQMYRAIELNIYYHFFLLMTKEGLIIMIFKQLKDCTLNCILYNRIK